MVDGNIFASCFNSGPCRLSLPAQDGPRRWQTDRPLIGYPIAAQAAAGIEEIAIVVGYLGYRVREVLGDGSRFGVRLSYISNDDYLGGNAVSVHKARQWDQGAPLVLCMADHAIGEGLVRRLVEK